MTVREFNGTSDELVTDVGAASGMVYGTVAALLKFSTITGFRDWTMLHTSGGSFIWTPVGLTNFSTFQMFSNGVSSNSGINPGTTSWKLVVVRKATGTTAPRFSVYHYDSATWTHAAGGSTLDDSLSPPGAGGQVRFTFQNAADFFGGRIMARALWSNSLPWTADAAGDTAIEGSGLEVAASNWQAANPSAFWLFNQASTATPVDDLSTAGTADQTSVSGTTAVTGDDPPGFNASLGGATDLVVQAATQAQTADSANLTQVHALIIDNATQAQVSDSPALTQLHQLAVAAALQGMAAQQVTLSQAHILAVLGASQAQSASSPVLFGPPPGGYIEAILTAANAPASVLVASNAPSSQLEVSHGL